MNRFPWTRCTFLVLTVERPKRALRVELEQAGYHYLRKNSGFDDETWIHRSLPWFDDVVKNWTNRGEGHELPHTCMIANNYLEPAGLMP